VIGSAAVAGLATGLVTAFGVHGWSDAADICVVAGVLASAAAWSVKRAARALDAKIDAKMDALDAKIDANAKVTDAQVAAIGVRMDERHDGLRQDLEERFDAINGHTQQLTANGGSHLADVVRDTAKTSKETAAQVAAIAAALNLPATK